MNQIQSRRDFLASLAGLGASIISASPYDNADHVLLLTCSTVSRPTEDTEILLSYGGFDAPEVMNDTSKHAVSCLYPAKDAEQLKKMIGTVDYQRTKA